ncbi:hypothetical protein [Labrys monachus]|uniref:J domain-containing protein n=1 Tax=Labrys monachus TaxID=217067 RepID=A0ABU0FF30_9HYPH|nr:hypothetical protein [Labrys monachus]MDQ0393061.1 hypothetical protein [Labrys monachus]
MTVPTALQSAIALFREPTRVKHSRSRDLPDDISFLLRVVSGDEQAIEEAALLSQRSTDFVIAASEFFIEQILFAPNADSYRCLGATPDASREKLRWHMVMLLKWLHPDTQPEETRAVLAVRVTKAWNSVKTQERRTAYDDDRPEASARVLLRRAASIRRAHDLRVARPGGRAPHPKQPDMQQPNPTGTASGSMPVPATRRTESHGLLALVLSFFQTKLKGV